MNDAQSTVAGLKMQDCPGRGDCGTVADCLARGDCGCIYGDAVQHIERMQRGLCYIKQTAETDDIPQLVALCDEALGAAVA
jgi:hypothetical protein